MISVRSSRYAAPAEPYIRDHDNPSNPMPSETGEEPMTGTTEPGVNMELRGVRINDTFAEAFDMRAARVLITANTLAWAKTGAQAMTGFATSVIGCKVEAGIEAELDA